MISISMSSYIKLASPHLHALSYLPTVIINNYKVHLALHSPLVQLLYVTCQFRLSVLLTAASMSYI